MIIHATLLGRIVIAASVRKVVTLEVRRFATSMAGQLIHVWTLPTLPRDTAWLIRILMSCRIDHVNIKHQMSLLR